LPDLSQVNLYSSIAIFGGHIAFLHRKVGVVPTNCRLLCSWLAP
jgi:hypothetical protein